MSEERRENIELWQQGMRERWMAFEDTMEAFGRKALDAWQHVERRPVIMRWTIVVLSVSVAIIIGRLLGTTYVSFGSQLLLFIPAVLLSALYGGWVPGATASLLGGAWTVADYFRDPVYLSRLLEEDHTSSYISLILYVLACTIVLGLNSAHHYHRRQAHLLAKELESRVAERTSELEAAHRELASFCYSISHDLRAPMRNIVGSSRILLEDAPEQIDPDTRKRLESMAASSIRLSNLVDDLLGYARLTEMAVEPEWLDLSRMAEEICNGLARQDWGFAKMSCKMEPSLIAGADPVLASMALRSLLENACKYCKPGEELVIQMGETRLRGKTWHFIRDNGIGFDMQFAAKIFEPFQKLHRDVEVPGTGIGLANVKRIIDRHGGEIWVQSEPGVGTTFYFNFGGTEPKGRKPASKVVVPKTVLLADEA